MDGEVKKAFPHKNCSYSIARFCYYSTHNGSAYTHYRKVTAKLSLAPIDSLIFVDFFEINGDNEPISCSYFFFYGNEHLHIKHKNYSHLVP